MKRLFAAAVALCMLALPSFAAVENVTVTVNGERLYDCEPILIDDTTYVELSRFRSAAGDTSEEEAVFGDGYAALNGRCVYFGDIPCDEGYLPIRAAAKLYGGEVGWNGESMTAAVECGSSVISGESFYDYDELYWLSRIISSESRGEPLAGKLAVGSVVMNRVKSEEFPNTIYNVIFDNEYGVQFTPTVNGRIFDEPTAESVSAAKMTLEGYRYTDTALYFIYEAIADNLWTVFNCDYEFTIGCHDFYS